MATLYLPVQLFYTLDCYVNIMTYFILNPRNFIQVTQSFITSVMAFKIVQEYLTHFSSLQFKRSVYRLFNKLYRASGKRIDWIRIAKLFPTSIYQITYKRHVYIKNTLLFRFLQIWNCLDICGAYLIYKVQTLSHMDHWHWKSPETSCNGFICFSLFPYYIVYCWVRACTISLAYH